MNEPIRIALVCTSLNQPGGKNWHFRNLYRYLDKDKFKVIIVICSKVENELRDFMLQKGVLEEDLFFLSRFKKWLILPLIIDLKKIFISREINIVHTFQMQSDFFGSIAAFLTGIRCLVSSQESKAIEENISVFKKIFYKLTNVFLKHIFKKTVAVSEGLKKELIAERLRLQNRIEVIPLGIGIPLESRNREFPFDGLRKRKPLIGTIARLSKEKGIDRFVEAIPFILEKLPQSKFVIVGKGDEKDDLQEQVKRLNLELKVEFRPWSDTVYDILENIDIFVMPSLREGCPTSLLEALAFSRPVVASNIQGIDELIEDYKSGLLVDTSNPRLFAQKILYLCENPDKAVSMGIEGRKKIVNCYTLEVEMARYQNLYQKALSDNPRKAIR